MTRSKIDQFFQAKEKQDVSKSNSNKDNNDSAKIENRVGIQRSSTGGFAEDLYSWHLNINCNGSHNQSYHHSYKTASQHLCKNEKNDAQSARQNQTFVVQVTPAKAQHVDFNYASDMASFGSKIGREGGDVVGGSAGAKSPLTHVQRLQLRSKSNPGSLPNLPSGSNSNSNLSLNPIPCPTTAQGSTCFANTSTNTTNGAKTSREAATNTEVFRLFPKFPLELRFRVWGFAAWQPRIIEIRDLEAKLGFSGSAARCPLSLVCREARRECLRVRTDVNATFTPNSNSDPNPNLNLALPKLSTDTKSASVVPGIRTGISDEGGDTGKPKVYANLAVDTLYLTFSRTDVYDATTVPPLWQTIATHPTLHARRLAVSYSLFKRRWDDMNAMVFKLDLQELVLVVDAEDLASERGFAAPVFVHARSEVGRRSAVWRDWEGVRRSEVRQLKDCRAHVRSAFKRALAKGETREQLLRRGKRDLENWKMPRISIRDLVDLKNATTEELAHIAEEDRWCVEGDASDDGAASESEEGEEYEYA